MFFGGNIFSIRTSSFPARRKSSSAFSRAGNDKGCMRSVLKRLFPALCFSSSLYRKKGKDPVECRLVLPLLHGTCSFKRTPGLTGVIVLVMKDIIGGLLSP